MKNRHNNGVSIKQILSFLIIPSLVFLISGCQLNENQAAEYINKGVVITNNLPISASSPAMGKDLETLIEDVFKGIPLEEIKRRVAAFDNDETIIKDAIAKANAEYQKVLKQGAKSDVVAHAKNLMSLNEVIIEINDKILALLHSYISSVEGGGSPNLRSIVTQSAGEYAILETKYEKLRMAVEDFINSNNPK